MHFTVGRWWQRLLAVPLVCLSVWLFFLWMSGHFPGTAFAISCVAAFLFVLMSIPPLYERWMLFAEQVSVWVTRVLFSLIYFCVLFLLQFLRYKDRLRLRSLQGKKTLWIDRQNRSDSLEELQRMG